MNVLVVDVGGTSVKILASGETEPRKFPSAPMLRRGWRRDRKLRGLE
jgi:hypothetical protein